MASIDFYNDVSPAQSLAPAARTASANGTSVDLLGFEGALVLIDVGAWTDGSHTFEVQESPDNVTFTPVADADLLGTEPVVGGATADEQVYRVGYIGSKRYIRVVVTVSGATSGAVYGALVARGYPKYAPVA